MKNENLEICQKCGGYCCKKSGCDYVPEDFSEISLNYLLSKLDEGYISIVSAVDFRYLPNGKIVNIPFLYLRARNRNRPIVDLLSMKTTCASLTENGCNFTYEERPTGGKNLTPVDQGICYPKENPIDLIIRWERYQDVLSKAVEKITGKSVDEQIRLDVEQLFLDLLSENTEGVTKRELLDIRSMIPELSTVYPEELFKAKKQYYKGLVTRKLKQSFVAFFRAR